MTSLRLLCKISMFSIRFVNVNMAGVELNEVEADKCLRFCYNKLTWNKITRGKLTRFVKECELI